MLSWFGKTRREKKEMGSDWVVGDACMERSSWSETKHVEPSSRQQLNIHETKKTTERNLLDSYDRRMRRGVELRMKGVFSTLPTSDCR